MYDAIDVARYVINYSQEIGSPVSNLKLQKILYFIQGIYLSTLDKPCFSDDIEAWGFGPVISDVYHEFKGFGSNDIPTIIKKIHGLQNSLNMMILLFLMKIKS